MIVTILIQCIKDRLGKFYAAVSRADSKSSNRSEGSSIPIDKRLIMKK